MVDEWKETQWIDWENRRKEEKKNYPPACFSAEK